MTERPHGNSLLSDDLEPPIFFGIQEEVFRAVEKYLGELETKISQLLDKYKPPHSQGQDCPEGLLAREKNSFNLLFADAGSGKTRSIELLLSKHWGFYLLSCTLPPTTTEDLYEARRSKGSRDT